MELKLVGYNFRHNREGESVMPKMLVLNQGQEPFGKRLAKLRKSAGYSQRALAAELNISYRVIAYYEGETTYPPAHLLPQLAKALGISTDQILGVEKIKESNSMIRDNRLWRRFSQVEKLPASERRPIIQIIDAVLRGKQSNSRV